MKLKTYFFIFLFSFTCNTKTCLDMSNRLRKTAFGHCQWWSKYDKTKTDCLETRPCPQSGVVQCLFRSATYTPLLCLLSRKTSISQITLSILIKSLRAHLEFI